MNVNLTKDFVIWKNDKIEVDLATLLDDIKIEDVLAINFDNTQSQELENMIEEFEFNYFSII